MLLPNIQRKYNAWYNLSHHILDQYKQNFWHTLYNTIGNAYQDIINNKDIVSYYKHHKEVLLDNFYTTARYSNYIAEKPKNVMGLEFYTTFGNTLSRLKVSKENMMDIAISIFERRLALSKKHDTNFHKHMVHNWEKKWEQRLNGQWDSFSRSFGIKSHERADGIFNYFKDSLSEKDAIKERTWENFVQLSWISKRYPKDVLVRNFPYEIDGIAISDFCVYKLDDETYYIRHANTHTVPKIMKRLTILRKNIQNSQTTEQLKMEYVAEFERLRFWTNPFGRSGALIGDSLSLLLQEFLQSNGMNVFIRNTYKNIDLCALTKTLWEYKVERKKELFGK